MNREQKIKLLKTVLAGKPMREGLPLIRIALMPTPETRPDHLFILMDSPDDMTNPVAKLLRGKVVRRGKEKEFAEDLQKRFPHNNVQVAYGGMSDDEYDATVEKIRKEYF